MTGTGRRAQNREARISAILDAALRVFARSGFTGASMEEIAREAEISKPTLYSYFDNKGTLFETMMDARRADMQIALEAPNPDRMIPQLVQFSRHYAATVLRPDMMSLARLVIGEVQRSPEIGRTYQAAGPDRLFSDLVRFLENLRSFGRLSFDDSALAAQDLWGLILSGPRTRALHDPDWQPEPDALDAVLFNGLSVFIKAYSTTPVDDLQALGRAFGHAPK